MTGADSSLAMQRPSDADVQNTGALDELAPGAELAVGNKRQVVKLVLIFLVLAVALAAIQLSPIRAILSDAARVREWLARMGMWAYPVCVVVSAVLVGCGFPRLVLCAVGAAILGFGWGLMLTQLGALLGYYAMFCFIRWGGGEWVSHRRPRLRAIADTIQAQGVAGVILARQIPIHGTIVNLCMGLSGVKHRHFLIGTAIGLFPEAIPVALVGAGLVKSSLKESSGWLALACIAVVAMWIGSGYALKWLRKRETEKRISPS